MMPIGELISLAISTVISIFSGVILWRIKENAADNKDYRAQREKEEKARDEMSLGIARVMLINFYEIAIARGYYTIDERQVYGKLFDAYKNAGGDGVIDDIAPMLAKLPTEPKTSRIEMSGHEY